MFDECKSSIQFYAHQLVTDAKSVCGPLGAGQVGIYSFLLFKNSCCDLKQCFQSSESEQKPKQLWARKVKKLSERSYETQYRSGGNFSRIIIICGHFEGPLSFPCSYAIDYNYSNDHQLILTKKRNSGYISLK